MRAYASQPIVCRWAHLVSCHQTRVMKKAHRAMTLSQRQRRHLGELRSKMTMQTLTKWQKIWSG